MLRPELRMRIPARVKQHKDWPDVVTRCDGEKSVDALLKSLWILLPEKVVEEDAHGVHTDALGPSQFAVDRGWIERVGLPHLEFVDCCGGQKICAHGPWLVGIPFVGLRFGPALLGVKLARMIRARTGGADPN